MLTAYTINQLLDIDKFRIWLAQHQPDEFIGVTREDTECPIANYLFEKLQLPEYEDKEAGIVSVDSQFITVYRKNGFDHYIKTDTPPWTSIFISRVDDMPDYYPEYLIYEDDETGEEFQSDEINDHMVLNAETCHILLDNVIESLEEMQNESEEEMLEEYNPFSARNSF